MSDVSADALAAIAAEAESGPKTSKGKMVPTIAAVAVLTLVAIAGGAGVGMLIGAAKPDPAPTPDETAAAAATEGAETAAETATADEKVDGGTEADPIMLVKLLPVITNIATPPKTLIRIEASIVLHAKDVENVDVLAAQIQADTMTFLRTVDLAQIEGARGLLHLREDLKERARLRSPAITDYLIQSMVAQ